MAATAFPRPWLAVELLARAATAPMGMLITRALAVRACAHIWRGRLSAIARAAPFRRTPPTGASPLHWGIRRRRQSRPPSIRGVLPHSVRGRGCSCRHGGQQEAMIDAASFPRLCTPATQSPMCQCTDAIQAFLPCLPKDGRFRRHSSPCCGAAHGRSLGTPLGVSQQLADGPSGSMGGSGQETGGVSRGRG